MLPSEVSPAALDYPLLASRHEADALAADEDSPFGWHVSLTKIACLGLDAMSLMWTPMA